MRLDNSNDNDGDDEVNNNKEKLHCARCLKPIALGKWKILRAPECGSARGEILRNVFQEADNTQFSPIFRLEHV